MDHSDTHLQSSVISRNPLVTGPRAGPMKVIIENKAIAFPRLIGSHISTNTPGEFDSAALANVPVKNRPTNNAAKFGAKAQRKLNAKYEMKVP